MIMVISRSKTTECSADSTGEILHFFLVVNGRIVGTVARKNGSFRPLQLRAQTCMVISAAKTAQRAESMFERHSSQHSSQAQSRPQEK